jgi:hypothetical protein
MPSDYDERAGYEEDHADRDDYPEEVWEQIQAERRRQEGGGDDDDLSEFINPPPPEPKVPSFTDEELKEMEEGWEKIKAGEYPQQAEPDKGEPFDPF